MENVDKHGNMENMEIVTGEKVERRNYALSESPTYSSDTKLATQANPKQSVEARKSLHPWQLGFIYFSLCSAIMLSIMDLTIVTTALYRIALNFGSLAKSYWLLLAYSLTELGFTVIASHLSDFLGRGRTLLLSFGLFLAFSLGSGFARSLTQLIIFRAFQGLGASGLYALGIILIVEITPLKFRPLIGGLIGAVSSFAAVLGPVLGGLLTHYASWRWIFWINAPICFIAVTMLVLSLPRELYVAQPTRKPSGSFDFVGTSLLLAASVLFVFGLQQGAIGAFAWNSAVVIVTLTIGSLCWVGLMAWEWRLSRKPGHEYAAIIPQPILTHRSLAASILITLAAGFTFFATVLLLPLRLQIVNRSTPASTGLQMLPMLFAGGFGSFTAGAVSAKYKSTCHTSVAGTSLILLGAGLFMTVPSSISTPHRLYGFQVPFGFGVGMIFSSVSIAMSMCVEPRLQSVVQGLASQARLLGGAIGVAATNAVMTRQAEKMLKGALSPGQVANLQFSTTILENLDESQRELLRLTYARIWKVTMEVCACVAAGAVVISLFTFNMPSIAYPRAKDEGDGRERGSLKVSNAEQG